MRKMVNKCDAFIRVSLMPRRCVDSHRLLLYACRYPAYLARTYSPPKPTAISLWSRIPVRTVPGAVPYDVSRTYGTTVLTRASTKNMYCEYRMIDNWRVWLQVLFVLYEELYDRMIQVSCTYCMISDDHKDRKDGSKGWTDLGSTEFGGRI